MRGITVQDRIYSLPTLPEGGGKFRQIIILRLVAARQQQPLLQRKAWRGG